MEKPIPVDETNSDPAGLDQRVLDAIGRALESHYDALVEAPLPKKFFDLLDQLDKEERQE
jgi:Anti-sigma factor NepR